ncbi:MAG TPA: alpha-L-arabinofuranosidase C-terminal domain-containing protein [Pirellulales bacterium]|nr:alpha-L-arabinofuranosidase C-terminal domain-containing protein [Pirellulales bacterium]
MKKASRTLVGCLALISMIEFASPAAGQEAIVQVDAAQVLGPVSRYLTGACIEDVNHEIYGGIYSQMVFGESFQEPSPESPVRGFKVFDGDWRLSDGEVLAPAGAGPKLVSAAAPFRDGAAGVQVYLADRTPGNAGLIVRLGKPGIGADNFDGYEISLDAQANQVLIGRHRHDWQLLRATPYDVPVGKWIALETRLAGNAIEVLVDGKRVVRYEDRERPLLEGTVALRPWQRQARYRHLWVKTGDRLQELPFEPPASDRGAVSGQWRPATRGNANGRFALLTDRPFIGPQSQQVEFVSGDGEVGIENRGLNRQGMCIHEQKPYQGYVWARAEKPSELWLTMEDADGAQRIAQTRVQATGGGEWQRLDFELTPDAAIERGRLAISLRRPGKIVLGHVFLQPGEWGRFAGLPDRRDVVEGLIEQKLTVLRYGGSMINHPEYRWKKMIGARDRRPPHQGTWYRYSTNGWGIFDFLDLCEAAGFLAVPALNMGESPQDMADFVEYVNGPADSPWGKRRTEDGHPQPYGLRYVELGNEERIDDAYFDRFRPMAQAIWAKDPHIIIVVGDFVYDHVINDAEHITGAASGITNLSGHRKLLDLAKQAGREIDFDVHIGTDGPQPSGSLRALPSYVAALEKLARGATHKVVVFEFNAGNHAFRRALGNAGAINLIERLAGRVTIAASANCLQVDGQNDNGWNQGLLFMNPCRVWPQPPYFVTQMVARNYQPLAATAKVDGAAMLDVSAKRSDDGKTLVLQVVNTHDKPIAAQLDIAGFVARQPTARVEELAAALDAVNTAAAPNSIRPSSKDWQHELAAGKSRYTFPAMSFTVLQFK